MTGIAEYFVPAQHLTGACRPQAGEQQRAALAKVLLLDPEILLLDEPTKGLDAEFKQTFALILRTLLARGVSLLMVSHDVEFCARYAHRCAAAEANELSLG